MAKKNTGNKPNKTVVATEKLAPTKSKLEATKQKATTPNAQRGMLFSKENFIWLGASAALVFIGIFLMAGGHQAPNEWNADEVYSFRRVTLAPMVMLAGLIVTLISIFKGSKKEASL